MRIRSVSYDALALEEPLPFALPLVYHAREPDVSEYWWRLLNFAFRLPDPYAFPQPDPLLEAESLHRYCDAAIDLAASQCLAHPSTMSVDVKTNERGELEESVTFDFPSAELVRGFVALFRQFYAPDEAASFAKARNLVAIAARESDDSEAARRKAELGAWGKAHSRLLAHNLKELVGFALADTGRFERDGIPDGGKPRELISVFAYGEHLHWGDQREVVREWDADAFLGPWNKMKFLEVCSGLAYFYMGFAVIVARCLGRDNDVERRHC